MALKNLILQKIKDEILNDPQGLGYAGKSRLEIVKLLNDPYTKEKIVLEEKPARINQILNQIAFAPNAISQQDLIDAETL